MDKQLKKEKPESQSQKVAIRPGAKPIGTTPSLIPLNVHGFTSLSLSGNVEPNVRIVNLSISRRLTLKSVFDGVHRNDSASTFILTKPFLDSDVSYIFHLVFANLNRHLRVTKNLHCSGVR
jgi:hypothetical protein